MGRLFNVFKVTAANKILILKYFGEDISSHISVDSGYMPDPDETPNAKLAIFGCWILKICTIGAGCVLDVVWAVLALGGSLG